MVGPPWTSRSSSCPRTPRPDPPFARGGRRRRGGSRRREDLRGQRERGRHGGPRPPGPPGRPRDRESGEPRLRGRQQPGPLPPPRAVRVLPNSETRNRGRALWPTSSAGSTVTPRSGSPRRAWSRPTGGPRRRPAPSPHPLGLLHRHTALGWTPIGRRLAKAWAGEPAASLPGKVASVTGACLLVRTDLFRRLGGFDEGYPFYWEDVDVCARAREAGARVFVVPDGPAVLHEGGASVARAGGPPRLPFVRGLFRYLRRRQGLHEARAYRAVFLVLLLLRALGEPPLLLLRALRPGRGGARGGGPEHARRRPLLAEAPRAGPPAAPRAAPDAGLTGAGRVVASSARGGTGPPRGPPRGRTWGGETRGPAGGPGPRPGPGGARATVCPPPVAPAPHPSPRPSVTLPLGPLPA